MSRTILIAALTALIATPAAAEDRQSAPAKESSAAAKKAKELKYCLTYEPITGSRTEKVECRTKAQWAKEGIDIDNPES